MALQDTFNFILFKNAMGVPDEAEGAYAFILKYIFTDIKTTYGIDISTMTEVPDDLKYAIFQHAKYLYTTQQNLTSVFDSVTDKKTGTAKYDPKFPKDILRVYRNYSSEPPAVRVDNTNIGI